MTRRHGRGLHASWAIQLPNGSAHTTRPHDGSGSCKELLMPMIAICGADWMRMIDTFDFPAYTLTMIQECDGIIVKGLIAVLQSAGRLKGV